MYDIVSKTEPSQKTIEQQVLDLRNVVKNIIAVISTMNLNQTQQSLLQIYYKEICGTITTKKGFFK